MNPDGYYYLHTNGSLIWKKFEPEPDSPFVKKIWPLDTSDRLQAWNILIEAAVLGADMGRISELAVKWDCNDADAFEYCSRVNLKLFKDGDQWCVAFDDFVNMQESECAFGSTALEALIEFSKEK